MIYPNPCKFLAYIPGKKVSLSKSRYSIWYTMFFIHLGLILSLQSTGIRAFVVKQQATSKTSDRSRLASISILKPSKILSNKLWKNRSVTAFTRITWQLNSQQQQSTFQRAMKLWLSSSSSTSFPEDIINMKVGDIRKELESYGIDTKSFIEKSEFVAALTKARMSQQKQQQNSEGTESSRSSKQTQKEKESESSSSSSSSRTSIYETAFQKATAMKVGEIKKELASMGISTSTFFEKTEFVKAYAEAIANGTKKSTSSSQKSPNEFVANDPTYRDVVMQKMDKRDPRMLGGTLIDITIR